MDTLYEYTVVAMLVHALRLRKLGVKLTPAELRLQTPLVGYLTLRPSVYSGRDGRGRWFCCVVPEEPGFGETVELYSARLLKIESRGILIAGEEESWARKRCTTFNQTIWAWPAPGGSPNVPPPGATLDSMKFVDAIAALV
nr:hypothetical protein [uncultured Roseateles sp.]